MADAVPQYLSRYAEPETELAESLNRTWAHVLVVPAYDEESLFVDRLRQVASRANALLIVVVNATDDAPERVHRANAELLAHAAGRDGVLAIDRASSGRRLPPGQGVGLARKIGCDVGLAAHVRGAIASPWIHSTDADVTLPDDYFDAAQRAPAESAAMVYRFRHDAPDTTIGRALQLYEASLRYYVLGLAHAGSRYAFHTIGSALAVRSAAYAAVRGVPKRQGAEDFYLLNKLAKVGEVWRADAKPIRIQARVSERVPFGTGPATARIAGDLDAGVPFRVYHPDSFDCVGEAIRAIELDEIPGELTAWALEQLGAPSAVANARRTTTTEPAFRSRMRQWFDAFRTLKLVHHIRDRALPMIAFDEALERAEFCPDAITELEAAERALRRA